MRCDLERLDETHVRCVRTDCPNHTNPLESKTRIDSIYVECRSLLAREDDAEARRLSQLSQQRLPRGFSPFAPVEELLEGTKKLLKVPELQLDTTLETIDRNWEQYKVCPEVEGWICKRISAKNGETDCARRREWVVVIVESRCDLFKKRNT